MGAALINHKIARFWIMLITCFLAGAEVDIFTPSLPEIRSYFSLSAFEVALTLNVNFAAYCLCSLFAGALGDRFDRRKVVLIGLLIFFMGSAFCVFAPNFTCLLLGRLLQGVGMSAPATLCFVVLLDDYAPEHQGKVIGVMNGIVTLSMAFAPLLGSYVNAYFSWRGNFVVLFLLSIVALLGCYLTINSRPGDKNTALSPVTYLGLLTHREFLLLLGGICFLSTTYWVFVGLSSLLYIESFGVSKAAFGFYQGSLCGVFSILSLLLPKILNRFQEEDCLRIGYWLNALFLIALIGISIWNTESPLLITAVMLIFSVGVVFPCNLLFPKMLKVLENSESRAAALEKSVQLLMTFVAIGIISHAYDGSFRNLGLGLVVTTLIGLGCFGILGMHRIKPVQHLGFEQG